MPAGTVFRKIRRKQVRRHLRLQRHLHLLLPYPVQRPVPQTHLGRPRCRTPQRDKRMTQRMIPLLSTPLSYVSARSRVTLALRRNWRDVTTLAMAKGPYSRVPILRNWGSMRFSFLRIMHKPSIGTERPQSRDSQRDNITSGCCTTKDTAFRRITHRVSIGLPRPPVKVTAPRKIL